ncbi:ATP-grasp domain-containing protein [Streptomyces sp. NPDC005195]|uniref:ATP-grasp domain-containing protein n=1 Tax=Streptomyces sp. NPDC005195 TaxID=3154561 RepID=UPI00339EFC6A
MLPADVHLLPDTGDFVVKPRRGQGAKDVYFCHTRRQAEILCELVADPIVQERVRGQEFSADCLVDRSGQASVILRKRLLVHGGASLVAATFHHPQAADLVRATLGAVGAAGPCDVQGCLTDDSDARPVVMTEINSRLAAGYRLSQITGADLVEQALNGLFGDPIDHDRLQYRPDVYLTKYTAVLSTRTRP